MHSLTLRTHVGKDGILKLETPVGIANAEVEIVLIVHPVEKKGWPPGFFEVFAGSIPDFPPRAPQGEYEVRDELS